MEHKDKEIISKPELEGQVGENAVWEGPLDTSGFPMGKGSSSGIRGMEVNKYPSKYYPGPITQIAKRG
jgi:hypothetical protein